MYFYVRLILHELAISLPHEDGFSNVKNAYIKSAYYSTSDDYGVDANEAWMHGDWFYTTEYAIFGHEIKATERSPPDNLTRWIITQSKDFTKKGIKKISRSVRAYVYLVLTSQVQASSSIVGSSAPAADAQQALKGMFKALINEDYSICTDIERYQRLIEHALSKVDFSVGIGIYMFPSNLNVSIGYNYKILVSNTDMKIGSNRDISRDHKKLTPSDVPNTLITPARYDPVGTTIPHNLKMLTEKHNAEKLVITLALFWKQSIKRVACLSTQG